MTGLSDLHSMPEIPSIAHFCSLFKNAFDLVDFEIEEFESALLREDNDDIFSATLIDRLVVKLLVGCLPMYASKIHDGNFSMYLKKLFQTKKEEAEEDEIDYDFDDPFEDEDKDEFSELPPGDQVKVIHQLTELRLQSDDVEKKLKDLDPEGLRLNPVGVDSDSVIYWYFYGTRLYKEIKTKRKKTKKKGEGSEDEADEGSKEAPGWYLACSAQSQWNDLSERLKKSKKKADKELYDTLNENFLPEITKMFTEKEREEKIKLLMANKRTSSRIERVKEKKEIEVQKRRDEEERREMQRREEEARRKQIEKENKEKNSRENRAKVREQKLLYARVISDHDYLLTNRKRVRAATSGENSGNNSEADDDDHEEEKDTKQRRKNPALREFQRLNSIDEQSDAHSSRNLRL